MKDLKGIYSALLIPFDEKGEVKEDGLRQVIEHNLNVCGVEVYTLTEVVGKTSY